MNKVKTYYIDNRFRTFDPVSGSVCKIESKEQLYLPDNAVCGVGDTSIPHTWLTIESHSNKFYTILKLIIQTVLKQHVIGYLFKHSRR